ncbi:hypothetical protein Tco_0320777 [Tanacetum coccineum]
MVAFLEKTNGNAEFHEIINFLTRSSIHYALTVSPVVSTTFVEQFWMTAKSKTINNVRYITATVAGKPVSISKASIRSAVSERPSETQPKPSPTHPSEDRSEPQPDPFLRPSSSNPIHDSIPEGSGGNHGGQSSSDRSLSGNKDGLTLQSMYDLCVSLCKQVTTQAAQIKDLKAQIKQLKKKSKPVISHHNAWIKSVSIKKRLARKKSLKTKLMQKESVSKQERKPTKSEPTVHKDLAFDNLDDAMDYIETEDAHDEGTVKDSKETRVSTEDQVSTDKIKVSTDKPNEGIAKPNEGIAEPKDGNSDESAAPTIVFRDDETIAQFLVTMSQNKTKQKGFEIKEIKDIDKPRTTAERLILTLKPLPKIDPKDKGKKVLEEKDESDVESKGVNEAERKFAQLANDKEITKKVQEEWKAEEEKKKLAKEEATKTALIRDYDDIQARIEADSILAARLQEEEREKSSQLKREPNCFMILLLLKGGGKKHSDLKNKFFEEIQVLYEKVKSSDENFVSIGSAEDERIIRELNKKAASTKKADSIKEESKEEACTRKRKLGTRKKMKLRKRRFRHGTSEDKKENDELKLCLTIAPYEDKEVDYEILDRKYPIIEWKTEYLGIKPQFNETKGLEESNLNVIIRSNGQRRYFSTLMKVLLVFDREDLNVVYKLVMDKYQNEVPEGFDRVLWGDLMIMFNPNDENEFWNTQQDWNVVSWKLHRSSGEHTLITHTGLVIYMLVEKKYPLRKKVLLQMLELKLESKEDSTMALKLIRFVKKLIAELEPEDSDGNEEDL